MFKDVRLLNGLDPNIHYTEKREVLLFPNAGDALDIRDWNTTEIETYHQL